MKAHGGATDTASNFGGSPRFPLSAEEGSGRLREQMGEYVLAEAVLWQAIREYRQLANHRTRREARLFRQINEWFLDNDEKWNFSFVNLCQILDLEPSCIRAGLRMMRERDEKILREGRFRTVQRKTVSPPKRRRTRAQARSPWIRGAEAPMSTRHG